MARSDDIYVVPRDLPVPEDDGACDHLAGMRLPSLALPATSGRTVDLSRENERHLVVYCYPRSGRPDEEPPAGWNAIPGARGCTPQAGAFRDHHRQLEAANARVYGLSTQSTAYQQELVERLHLPFEVLSDAELHFAGALGLPTFQVRSMTLIKRLTIIAFAGIIEKVFYPVFPPHSNPQEVLHWLSTHSR